MSFLTSLNHQLFNYIAYVGYLWHFVISCICVFVFMTVGNMSVDVLGFIRFYFGQGDIHPNKQPGEPCASLLVESKEDFCNLSKGKN